MVKSTIKITAADIKPGDTVVDDRFCQSHDSPPTVVKVEMYRGAVRVTYEQGAHPITKVLCTPYSLFHETAMVEVSRAS